MSGAKGGCLCGAVRFRAAAEPLLVSYCHCRDCRKATGAPFVVLVGYRIGQTGIFEGVPQRYSSSPGIRRAFCGRCGTPLSYEDERLPGEIYFMVGAFDQPERFKPDRHAWTSQRLPWLQIDDDLERHERHSRARE